MMSSAAIADKYRPRVTTLRHTKVAEADPLGLSNIQGDVMYVTIRFLVTFYNTGVQPWSP